MIIRSVFQNHQGSRVNKETIKEVSIYVNLVRMVQILKVSDWEIDWNFVMEPLAKIHNKVTVDIYGHLKSEIWGFCSSTVFLYFLLNQMKSA